jgi:CubicO group peptidase (beta-lactamase class C family)
MALGETGCAKRFLCGRTVSLSIREEGHRSPKGRYEQISSGATILGKGKTLMSTRIVLRSVTLALGALLALVVLGMTQALATGDSPSQADGPDFDAIDGYVQEQMQEMRMPGAALGIVKGDEIVHLEGFGEADDSGREVTPQTPFKIGSTSKSFTALAIMQLVEDGKVDLDAPVQRYIPWFRVVTPDASARITVRHLLNQTSGLPPTADTLVIKEDGSADALEKGVRALRTVELDRPVGESFEYANFNYVTLGLIVQMVSGDAYERYVEEHILTPLGMNNSYMFVPEAERHGLSTGHQYYFGRPFSGGGLAYNRGITPAGLIASDAQDMSHYLIAQLNEGRYQDAQVLSPTGMAELHRGTADMGGGYSYAMGWVDSEIGGVPVVWHNGDTADFHTTMFLVPESSWGVVLLMNGSNDLRVGRLDTTASGVVARLVGAKPPPQPGLSQETYFIIFLVFLAAGVLQALGIARSVQLLRRWRAHPELRPSGAVGVGLRVVVPFVLNLLWVLVALVVVPRLVESPLWTLVYQPSDVGLVVVLSGGLALVWGVVLRPVLALSALRAKGAPGDAPIPQKARVSVRA